MMIALFEDNLPDGLSPPDLTSADLWTLDALFGVLTTIVEESGHPPAEAALRTVYAEMDARGAAPVADLHDHHLARRDFAAAAALRAAHPSAELAAPPVVEGGPTEGRTVLLNGPDGTLVPQAVEADYTGVLVLTSARCGFSKAAEADIAGDRALDMALAEAVWGVPPSSGLADPAILQHNAARPHRPLRHLADRREWPMLTVWATPTFYFVRDGEVVHVAEGWPPNQVTANANRLREGYAAIGRPIGRASEAPAQATPVD